MAPPDKGTGTGGIAPTGAGTAGIGGMAGTGAAGASGMGGTASAGAAGAGGMGGTAGAGGASTVGSLARIAAT
jgi:hypothetical protein